MAAPIDSNDAGPIKHAVRRRLFEKVISAGARGLAARSGAGLKRSCTLRTASGALFAKPVTTLPPLQNQQHIAKTPQEIWSPMLACNRRGESGGMTRKTFVKPLKTAHSTPRTLKNAWPAPRKPPEELAVPLPPAPTHQLANMVRHAKNEQDRKDPPVEL